jgi:hypothetical protein
MGFLGQIRESGSVMDRAMHDFIYSDIYNLQNRVLTAKTEQRRSLFAKLFVLRWAQISGRSPESKDGVIIWCNRGDLL